MIEHLFKPCCEKSHSIRCQVDGCGKPREEHLSVVGRSCADIAQGRFMGTHGEAIELLQHALKAIDDEWGECGCVGGSPDCPDPSRCLNCEIRAYLEATK